MKDFANLHLLNHSLVSLKIHELKHWGNRSENFRRSLDALTMMLGYEACRDISLEHCHARERGIQGGVDERHIMLIPVLRAGLDMLEPMLSLFCCAQIGGLGFFNNPETNLPKLYHCDLNGPLDDMEIFVLEPAVVTGKTMLKTVECIKQHGGRKIRCLHVMGTPQGIAELCQAHPDVEVFLSYMVEQKDECKCLFENVHDGRTGTEGRE